MADEVLVNKADIIEKCILRIRDVYQSDFENLSLDQTKQDSIILNLERACHASIDMALRKVKLSRLGLPKESREVFDLIHKAGLIDLDLLEKMHGLVGFRNTAIHNYTALDLNVVKAIVENHLDDFLDLSKALIRP
jgi:uncharacterized protein YutE (UPF0331/DUF86 family)